MCRFEAENDPAEPGSVDELTRVFALTLKYSQVPQGVLIHDLSAAGLAPARIATLLGTSPGTVSTAKGKPRPKWPK